MESVIMKRAIGIFSIILIIILASVGCQFIGGDEEDPKLDNPDEVFMNFGNVEVTNEMLYNRIKARDGFVHLFNQIDALLLEDYMDEVTDEQIDDYINEIIYRTSDPEEIDRLTEGEKEELEQDFNDLLLLEGFDPSDDESVDAFARLYLAQLNYVQELYITGGEEDSFYISDDDLERFYNDYKRGDATVVPLRFFDRDEMRNVFNHFNLIEDFEGGFAIYTGERDIEEVGRSEYNEDNTEVLEDDEVLEYFIKVYNYLNQHNDDIDETLSVEGLNDLEYEGFSFNQMDLALRAEERQSEPLAELSDYIFNSLYGEERPYNVSSRQIGGSRLFFYLVDTEEITDFDDLSDTELEDLKEEYVDVLVGDDAIESAMSELHQESGLKIHDSKLAMRYEMQTGIDIYEANSDKSLLASADDLTLTTNDFFENAVSRVGAMHLTDLAKIEYLFDSEYFEAAYGSSRNVFRNSSDMMRMHRDDLRQEKNYFGNNVYAQFGISPEAFEWNEYLYLFGQAQQSRQQILQMTGMADPLVRYSFSQQSAFLNEEDMLRQMVERTIRYEYMVEEIDFEAYFKLVEDNYEDYFSLTAEHLLVHVDFDLDFAPDNFDDYYDALSQDDQDHLDTLRQDLHTKIFERVDDGDDLEDVVEDYMQALRGENEDNDDYSEWAKFRNAGFRIMYESLNEGEALNAQNTRDYAEAFVEGLREIYQTYDEEEDFMVSEDLVHSQFGLHFIKASEGPNFEIPSAQVTSDMDEYDSRIANDEDALTVEQIEYYTRSIIDQFMGSEVDIEFPQDVQNAISIFYDPILNALLSEYKFTMLMADEMFAQNVAFSNQEEHLKAQLEGVSEFYARRLFPGLSE